MAADITHTLGLDETEFVRGFQRAEQRARQFDGSLKGSTASVKSMQEGFQRVQGLVMGTVGALGAVAVGVARVASGVAQFMRAGEIVQRELEGYRQINIELDAQLSTQERITREINDRYDQSLRKLGEKDTSPTGMMTSAAERFTDATIRGHEGDNALVSYLRLLDPTAPLRAAYAAFKGEPTASELLSRQFIESQRGDAMRASRGKSGNDADLEFTKQRLALEKELFIAKSQDPLSKSANTELAAHSDRMRRIGEIDDLDARRKDELLGMENRRHSLALSAIEAERRAIIARGDEAKRKEEEVSAARRQAEAEQRANAEERIRDNLEDIRLSQLRASGSVKEAEIEETRVRFARLRRDIEGSDASSTVKAAELARLRELEATGLSLAGRSDADPRSRTLATGLGSAAARQVLGGNGMRTVERVTNSIDRNLKELVTLAKRANAPMLATFG